MSTPTEVEQLRARARHLRTTSAAIGSSRAVTVHSLAGPDTWVGPTPQACHEALVAVYRLLRAGQQSLEDSARSLERRADQLERQPAVRSVPA